jgi:putative ABC transport system permease protein
MFKLNLKIALRNLWKNKGITAINIGGLAIALATFILVVLYATFETSYDKENPNYDRIYLIGRNYSDQKTNYTPPPLTNLIRANIPEVELVAKMKGGFFEFPINSDKGRFYTKNSVSMDYEFAKMFHIIPDGGLKQPATADAFLPTKTMEQLFPGQNYKKGKEVIFGPKSFGQTNFIAGTISRDNAHSNINFDLLVIGREIGKNEDYGYNNYYTYLQVKPATDVKKLESKINKLYKAELIKAGMDANGDRFKSISIFLDPLANQHLKPRAGNDSNYKVLIAITVLGLLIMLIACINFTNLSIAQATKRAKEVGVKKVMGAYRFQLICQFLTEILIQALAATVLGLMLAELILPAFNHLFAVELSIWNRDNELIWQLPTILAAVTIIAGIYPALVLSGFKPAAVLKGNFSTGKQSLLLKNGLLVVQFSVAVIFIIGLFTISSQLKYMRYQDVGFRAEQVVAIKNMAIFNDPKVFAPIRDRIMQVPGVKSVTVATSLPDGSKQGTNSYTIEGREQSISFLDVDFDYFETLGIKLKEGRFFNQEFATDTANSTILNESAIAKYGLINPIGKVVKSNSINYTIVGVVKDFKTMGFENAVEPSIYAIKNPNGNQKTSLMIKIEEGEMSQALATLKSKWANINKLDGEDFRYDFLDQLYGKLFQKQEQLQSVFFAAASLTIFIAVLGLFAFAKYITNGRIKEIAVRKILGASDLHILKLINTSFFMMVVIANLLSWPLAYILIKTWLKTFAYRIDMPIAPFVLSALITICLTIITVSAQARSAVKANPVDALKYE